MNDNYQPVGLTFFFGGQSSDKQLGSEGQFYDSEHVDFRKNPSHLSLLPETRNADGGVVVDLVQNLVQVNSGKKYAIGDAGNLYLVETNDTWSVLSTLSENGTAGLEYRADVDHLYIPLETKIARIRQVSSTATLQGTWFEEGISNSSTCYKTGGSATYTVPVTPVSETATDKRSFTTDIEPISKIGVKVVAKGTGDWTLTLHDDANTSLGTVTIANASLTNGAINYFTFSTPIRVQRGKNGAGSAMTYHYHLTSTVADGMVQTTTASSLADCDMELYASALVDTMNGLHPTLNFANYTLFGNGRYVAQYEPLQDNPTTSDFDRHRLTLPPGFEVCGFAQKNLMSIIAAEKRSSTGDFQEGMLFFWDGFSETFNDYWPVPEGSPESLYSHKNTAYFIAGGALYRIRGSDEPIKVRTFRDTDSEYSGTSDVTHVNPYMMAVRRGVLLMGYPSTTTNLSLKHGVYSLGAVSREYPESFGYSYSISSGAKYKDADNDLKIGMIKNFGDKLYMSWRDDDASPQAYSVDVVDNTSDPNTSGYVSTLQFDDGRPQYWKRAGYIVAVFEALPAGATVKVRYKLDDATSWTESDEATEGDTYIVFPVGVGGTRFKLLEFGAVLGATTLTPKLNGIFCFVDPLKGERPIGVA